MKKKIALATTLLVLTLGITGCGSTEPTPVGINTFFEVTVQDNRSIISVGEEVKISYELYGTTSDEVTFTSSNENVLTVSTEGVAKGVRAGVATITVASVSNPDLTKDIQIQVATTLGQKNPQLQEMADSINSYNYENGVRYNGEINVDLGDPKAMGLMTLNLDASLPLTIEVQNKDTTNVHIAADVERLVDQDPILGIDLNAILSKTVGALISPEFDNYTIDADYQGAKYLDIYSFDSSLDYTVGYRRNFGDETTADYRTFLMGEGNVLKTLSPLGDTLLGVLTGSGEESSETTEEEGGLDLGSLLSYEGILNLTNTLYGFFNVETTEDSTTLSLNDNALTLVNNFWTGLGIGGAQDLELNGIPVNGVEIPTSFTNVSFYVENKGEGENKFSNFNFKIDALNSKEEEYNFLEVNLEKPEELSATYFDDLKTDVNAYKDALTTQLTYGEDITGDVITATKFMTNLRSFEDTYKVAENDDIKLAMNMLTAEYLKADGHLKDLMYPIYTRIMASKYGMNEYVNGRFSLKELGDGDVGQFYFDHINEKIDLSSGAKITYRSDNSSIIKMNEDGSYEGVAQTYTGRVNAGNVKATSNSTYIYADVEYTDAAGEEQKVTFRQLGTKYTGERRGFNSTKSLFNENAAFDQETHELKLASNSTFDLKGLVKLPDGATDVTYSFKSNDTKIATVDKEGKLQVLTGYLETVSGEDVVRNIAGLEITLKYTLGEESVNEKAIVFVNVTDNMVEGTLLDSTIDGVTVDKATNTITAKVGTEFDLTTLFGGSTNADEGSLKVKFNGLDAKLYDEKTKTVLAPYIASNKLNENGEFDFVNTSTGVKVYADVTYTVEGVAKTERVYFTFVADGEGKQSETTQALITDPKYNKETNTLTLTKADFGTVVPNDDKTLAYSISLEGDAFVNGLSISDSTIIGSKSYYDKEQKQFEYFLQYKEGMTGKVGVKLTIKTANDKLEYYIYVQIN